MLMLRERAEAICRAQEKHAEGQVQNKDGHVPIRRRWEHGGNPFWFKLWAEKAFQKDCLKQWFLKVIATFKNSIQEPTIWKSWKVGFVYITAICHSTLLWFKNHRCCLLVLLMARHTGFLCQAVFNWWLFSVVFLIMTVLGKGHN